MSMLIQVNVHSLYCTGQIPVQAAYNVRFQIA